VIGRKLVDFYLETLAGDLENPDLAQPGMRARIEQDLHEALSTGESDWLSRVHEHAVQRPDGQQLLVQFTTFPIRTQRGNMIGVMTRDVTGQRLAEKELERYRQHLEEMVADRTAQLRREIRERLQVEENLQIMLREVHHRVKNNLSVIISLIELQKGTQEDPRVLAAFQDLQNRAYSMALVHESLYRSPNLAQVNFSSYLSTLVDYLQAAYMPTCCGRPVQINVEAGNVPLGIETAIPCGLMVSELVTNAMKYAFPPEAGGCGHEPCTDSPALGQISVRLEHAEGPGAPFVLTVCDDGVGFSPGFDWRSAPTLGLQLVRVLARQLGGTLSLDSGCGIAWRFEFEERK
jgi:two-component sensor histidine kinase